MIRSLYSGIGGMNNFQTKLDVIGNNISNVNTFGFKKGRVTFNDLVSQQLAGASSPQEGERGGTNPRQVGLGGSTASIDTINTQGSLQSTGRDLDMAISGDGFFQVADGGQNFYTRAGNFYLDENGMLVNADGLRLQGYGVGDDGAIDEAAGVGDLFIPAGEQVDPEATSQVDLRGNLNADSEIGEERTVRFFITDPLGGEQEIRLLMTKTAENEWDYSLEYWDNDIEDWDILPDIGQGFFDFSGTEDGVSRGRMNLDNLELIVEDLGFIGGPWEGHEGSLNLNLSNVTQFSSRSTVEVESRNGSSDGTLESYTVSETGEINGIFSNGEVRLLGQVALVNFNNPSGLSKAGSNLFEVSNNSGEPQVGLAGIGGRGSLVGATLEMSNVDLSEEFAEMIVSQRGFQANTRMITTSDEILQELINLKR
ncbi:flagellar basal-body rod protein FlgF [Salisediminibacterium selenitireducens]|uniref:Fagellar hook-basal body protein n=1 Tax=Bacillus selenitireducens (strain ATCC 700615 / DSM 15326 / MLS10) TaxID=439292 RepID=D6XTX2_BACIE|nr:flagellar basal-body rod protein FlgF [Salisediminibacterium selenitireducens]ADH99258.1 fagellar hook-basal body protein [[Bacillus] selenitireducens MLS10]